VPAPPVKPQLTDAYATLREMLANVPDDAQVYVREMEEVVVEWPGITAGTYTCASSGTFASISRRVA